MITVLLWLNACALVGFSAMFLVLTDYLAREVANHGLARYRFQGALAIYIITIGGMISFGSRWWLRYAGVLPPAGPDGSVADYGVVIIGGAFLNIGLLCWMRVWTPKRWRPWPVLITAVSMFVLAAWGPVAMAAAVCFLLICWFFAYR